MTEQSDAPNKGVKSEESREEISNDNLEYQETSEEEGLAEIIGQEIANAPNPTNVSPYLPTEKDSFGLISQTAKALGDMGLIADNLIKSGLCPLKKKEDVILAIITGNQYGLPFMTSVNNIFPINGKPTLSIHLHRAMLIQHKVMFKKIYDYEPVYEFAVFVEGKDGNGNTIKKPNILGTGTLQDKERFPPNAVMGNKIVDRITKYRFSRKIKQDDGTFETLEVFSEFRMSQAVQAGLTDKQVWANYPERMCDARAFGIGSKEIASDILFGIYSISELADVNNVPYSISSNLEEVVIDKGKTNI